MTIQKILTLPDPFLKKKVLYVINIDEKVRAVVSSMTETMKHHPHCVGIAASQIGVDMRIIAVDVSCYRKKYPNNGFMILINPSIIKSCGKQVFREGCLSVPEFTGNVSRAEEITVQGKDVSGKLIELSTSGFEAVVFQHEIDHLDGILFLDRVSSLKTDVFRRKQPDPDTDRTGAC